MSGGMYTKTNQPDIYPTATNRSRYEACIESSKQVRWEIDKDVLRGRQLDFGTTFLPDGLTKVGELPFLSDEDRRLLSQIQGRTYATSPTTTPFSRCRGRARSSGSSSMRRPPSPSPKAPSRA